MDPDVEALVRQERLLDAARLASERSDPRTSSMLYERACAWAPAAREALAAGEPLRAFELAIEGGDDTLAESAIARLSGDKAGLEGLSVRLSRRGRDRWAARLLETSGDRSGAARAWERAGDAIRAATLLEENADPVGAARILEAAQRREPRAWAVTIALGSLLERFGKHEAAVRALQRVPPDAPERAEALSHLVPSLERLGLARAAADAAAELASSGGVAVWPVQAAAEADRGRIFGRYDVVREVASSPSARVLECVDVVRGEPVAVKIFAAWDARGSGRDALARFEREVRTMRVLDHANVVGLRDFIPEGPAIVLEWMPGGTLEGLLATAGALVPARAVEIAVGVLSALGEAHRLGILHRDVKPANVLFDEAGGARLGDFGVAHLGDASTTATAGVFGTLAYMSPEQREGHPASPRSDVYSVGVMLREMLTGTRPALGGVPPSPSAKHGELGPAHDALVARLSAHAPEARPAGAFEARGEIVALAWPVVADASAGRIGSERASSAWPRGRRVEISEGDGVPFDSWTARPIERIPLTESTLARARVFATVAHPALQTVLRVDRDEQTIWLEALAGPALDRPLARGERARLEAALGALHVAGGVHGHVDAAHVAVRDEGVVLRFEADHSVTDTVDRDRLGLARL